MVLVSTVSNFFIDKMFLANNWRRKKIPTSVNSALASRVKFSTDYKNFFEQGGELFKTEHALIIET